MGGCVCGRDGARGRQQQCDGVFARGVDVGRWRVRHRDTARGCGVDVDVVYAHACATDDLQTLGCVDDLAVYRGGRADDERIGVADRLEEIGAAGPGDAADFYRIAQGLFCFRRERVRNEHDWCVREHWFSLGDLKGKRPLILSVLVCVFRLTDALLELL